MVESLGLFAVAFTALSWYWMVGIFVFGLWFVVAAFDEQLGGAAIMFALFLGLTQFSGLYDLSTIDFISAFYTIVIYLAVGCVWSLFKYKITAKKIADEYIEDYKKYRYTPEQLKENILLRIESRIYKSKISCWIVFFPFSILNFMFGDFVEYIVSKLGRVYRKIAEYVTESVISNSIKSPVQTKE